MDVEKIARGYLEYQSSDKSSKYKNLFKETICLLGKLNRERPELAWEIILKIIEITDDEWMLTLVGCGELESLLNDHFEKFIDRVEDRSRSCKKFAHAMSCVWQNQMTDEQYAMLNALVDELGIERT